MTLFEIVSTGLAFYALVRESDYANAVKAAAGEAKDEGVTSEGVTRKLLSEEERHGAGILVNISHITFSRTLVHAVRRTRLCTLSDIVRRICGADGSARYVRRIMCRVV